MLVYRAHAADKYVKRLGKRHPEWGDGSLRAVAIQHNYTPIRTVQDEEWRRALALVIGRVNRPKVAARQGV